MANKVIRDAIWQSKKLDQVNPEEYRDHYPRLLLYGFMDGTFEFDIKAIWFAAFAYNRPGITPTILGKILLEYERVDLLRRWTANGKDYGYWVGTTPPTEGKHWKKSGIILPDFSHIKSQRDNDVTPVGFNNSHGDSMSLNVSPGDSMIPTGLLELELEKEKEEEAEGGTNVPEAQPSEVIQEESDRGIDLSASFSLSSKDKSKNGSPVAKTEVIFPDKQSSAPQDGGYKPRGAVSMSRPLPAKNTVPVQTAPTPAPENEPWDALDFAMLRKEPFCGMEPKILRRVVWHHWKQTQKPFWSVNGRVDSLAKLEKHLPMMYEQMPPDTKVPGDATIVLPFADPNCKLCDGHGWTPGPHPGYTGINYQQGVRCPCMKDDIYPWRSWKPRKSDEE